MPADSGTYMENFYLRMYYVYAIIDNNSSYGI